MNFFIETERLILREILPTDESELFELDSNPNVSGKPEKPTVNRFTK
jgi:RimJ/RimL family protein N-acetyltransferase